MKKENLHTRPIHKFTTEDTIYIRRMKEFNQPLYLCQFVKYVKGLVYGKILWCEGKENDHSVQADIEKGLVIAAQLKNCALYGGNVEDKHKHYHWFGSQGYAMHPLEKHKVLESGVLHVEKHPSFGVIHAARQSNSHPKALFGSAVKGGNTIAITISTAVHDRHLHNDYIHEDERIIEIEMSQTQFAEMMTSLNYGGGTPCTIKWYDGDRVQEPPYMSKTEQFQEEFRNRLHNIGVDMKKMVMESVQMLKNKDYLNKGDRQFVISQIEMLVQDIQKNVPFVNDQFMEQMDKTVTEAKGEIEAYVNHVVQKTGVEALRSGLVPPAIEDKSNIQEDEGKE
jgi:hypothetical protein